MQIEDAHNSPEETWNWRSVNKHPEFEKQKVRTVLSTYPDLKKLP